MSVRPRYPVRPGAVIGLGLLPFAIFLLPSALFAQEASVLVVESHFDCDYPYPSSILLVDPGSGDRRVLIGSEESGGTCVTVGSGPFPYHIYALGSDLDGRLLVADGDGTSSRILKVDPTSGASTVLSGCTVSDGSTCTGAVLGSGVFSTFLGDVVAVNSVAASNPAFQEGDLVVGTSRYLPCSSPTNVLVRIDRLTGDRVTLSGLDDDCSTIVGAGDEFVEVNGILLLDDGTLLIADGDGGVGRIVSVDPETGDRTVLSGCSDATGPIPMIEPTQE